MSKKKPPEEHKPKGPAPIELPTEQVLELSRHQWPVTAIAAFFKVSVDTVYRRVPAVDIDAARSLGVARLRQALFSRAMGGKVERKNADGSITIVHTRASDRLLGVALDRFEGKVAQTVVVNPDPKQPVHIVHNVEPAALEAALAKLNAEY